MADTGGHRDSTSQGAGRGPLSTLASCEAMSFGRLTSGMNLFGSIWIIFLVVLVVGDVGGRELFNYPIPATKEMIQLSIPGIVFLQLANTLRGGRHVSSDVLMGAVQRRWPRIAVTFYAVFNLIGAAMMGMIAVLMVPKAWQAYDQDFEKGTQGILTIPEWPVMALVVFGAAVMAIQYLILSIRDFHAAATGHRLSEHLHETAGK